MNFRRFYEILVISFGVLLMSAGFYYFIMPHNIVPGGFSGLAVILTSYIEVNIAYTLYALNFMALLLGYFFYGKKFLAKTLYGSFLFPFGIQLCEFIDNYFGIGLVSKDIMLSIVFGSMFLGIGLGIVLKYGGTTGGMDIPQKILKTTFHIPFSTSVYLLDGLIVIIGSMIFGLEIGLYSLLTVLISGRFIDMTLLSGRTTKSVYIITNSPEEIKDLLYIKTDRGVTEIDIVGGYSGEGKTMLLCVVTNREYYNVIKSVHEVDDKAFVFVNNSAEVLGEGFSGFNSVH